jgi:lipopolysaccharide export LptBFGC system permease protein LptF
MKPFTTLAVLLFALMALAHLYRLLRPFEVAISGSPVPQWVSLIGLALPALLALMVWRESRR